MLAEELRRIALPSNTRRFSGNSSGAILVRTALDLKEEYMGNEGSANDPSKRPLVLKRPYFWSVQPVRGAFVYYPFLCLHSFSGNPNPKQLRH